MFRLCHSLSLLRSEGNSHATEDADPEIGDLGDGDDKLVLEDTGNERPAALIATFSGIVMNG